MYHQIVRNDGQRFKLSVHIKTTELPTLGGSIEVMNRCQDFSILPTGQIHTFEGTSRPLLVKELEKWCQQHDLKYEPTLFTQAKEPLTLDGALTLATIQLLKLAGHTYDDDRLLHNGLVFLRDSDGFIDTLVGYFRGSKVEEVAEVHITDAVEWVSTLLNAPDLVATLNKVDLTLMHAAFLRGTLTPYIHAKGKRFLIKTTHLDLSRRSKSRTIRFFGNPVLTLLDVFTDSNFYTVRHFVSCNRPFIIWTIDEEEKINRIDYSPA